MPHDCPCEPTIRDATPAETGSEFITKLREHPAIGDDLPLVERVLGEYRPAVKDEPERRQGS
jgi:hypothetical protein